MPHQCFVKKKQKGGRGLILLADFNIHSVNLYSNFIIKGYLHVLLLLIITENYMHLFYTQLNEALSTLPLFLEKLFKLGG